VGRVRSSSPHLPAPPSHCVPVPAPVPLVLVLVLVLSLSFPWSPSQLLPVSILRAVAPSSGWGCCCGGGRCGGGRRCAVVGGSRPRSPALPGRPCRPSRRGLSVCRSPPIPLVLRPSSRGCCPRPVSLLSLRRLAPSIHPASSGSQGWCWVLGRSVGLRSLQSARYPPCEQGLAVVEWRGSVRRYKFIIT
jgi:hypothetical protein